MRSYVHLPTRLRSGVISSLEFLSQLDEAARDSACDRARRQLERLADRPVALVPSEETVEDLAAASGQAGHCLVDVERLVDARDCVLVGILRGLVPVGRLLA